MNDPEEVEHFGRNVLLNTDITDGVTDRWAEIIFGEYSMEEFGDAIQEYDQNEKCSAHIEKGTKAFRCYTCSYSPNVAICEECFDIFDHEGHNYKQFTSKGGICDCGDPDALKPEGFCESHGKKEVPNPPPSLLENASTLIPFIMVKFVMVFERGSTEEQLLIFEFVNKLIKMSHCFKEIFVNCLMDESLFNEFFQNFEWSFSLEVAKAEARELLMDFDRTLPEEEIENGSKNSNCILDWLFKCYIDQNFPKSLSTLLINLMPVENYKVALTESVTKVYIYMITKFLKDTQTNKSYIFTMPIITAQLLSCKDSIKYIVEKTSFIMHTLCFLRAPIVILSQVVVNWPPAQEAASLFAHKSCVDYFLSSRFPFIMFIKGPTSFQGFGIEKRLTDEHVEEDDPNAHKYFQSETNICELPLLTMLPNIKHFVNSLIHNTNLALSNWTEETPIALRDELTFNIPLHRVHSLILSQQMRHGYLSRGKPELKVTQLKNNLQYPLRLKAGLAEIWCKKWIRNGLIVQEKAYLYKNARYFSCFHDPDLFLIQFISSRLSPDYMVEAVIDHFSIMEVLAQDEWYDILTSQNMMEETLFFFAQLLSSRVLAGETEDGLMREEFVTMLSLSDRTYNEIIDNIPYNGELVYAQWCSSVEPMLDELAVFAPPGIDTLFMSTSGKYTIKDEILLNEFDPVLVRMRALSLEDYTEACQNYYKCVDKNRMKENIKALWPPFRVPTKPVHPFLGEFSNFLHTHIMHGLIYVLLSECIVSGSNEGVMQITIHLLHMILVFPYNSSENSEPPPEGDIFRNCLVPMHTDYEVLNPYGLNNLFKENSHVTPPSIPLFSKTEKIDTIIENARRENLPLPPIVPPKKPEIPSDQTIVSMLLKLYERYAGKLYDPTELHQRNDGLRIGGGDFFIGEVLDALVAGSDEVRKVVEDSTAVDDGAAKRAKLEKKKKMAKLKMKKMMDAKKEKAKKFLAEADPSLLTEDETQEEEEEIEEIPICCICNEEAGPQEDNPPSFLGLNSETNIMGFRSAKSSPNQKFSQYFDNLHSYLQDLYPQKDFRPRWYNSGLLQTCGHIVHSKCWLTHTATLKSQRKSELPEFELEFWCPMCRQLCNTVLPLSCKGLLETSPMFSPTFDQIKAYLKTLVKPQTSLTHYNVVMFYLNRLGDQHMTTLDATNFYRNHVEIELIQKRFLSQRKISVTSNDPYYFKPTKKIHLGALFYMCSNFVQEESSKPKFFENLFGNEANSFVRETISVMDLRHQVTKTLLYFNHTESGSLQSIICFYINLYVIQLLTWIVICTDERKINEWIVRDNILTCEFGSLLELILEETQKFRHEGKKSRVDTMSEKVVSSLSDFLRYCLLVYNSALHPDEPTVEDIDQLEMKDLLSIFIGGQHDNSVASIRCYNWDVGLTQTYINRYVTSARYVSRKKKELKIMKTIMTTCWEPPKFIDVESPFEVFRLQAEDEDTQGVCLLCGNSDAFLVVETSKETEDFNTIKLKKPAPKTLGHAYLCGRGTCFFLGAEDNSTTIIWEKRLIIWNSIFVDKYGQDDILNEEGREMNLDRKRLQFLQCLWLFNHFDRLISDSLFSLP